MPLLQSASPNQRKLTLIDMPETFQSFLAHYDSLDAAFDLVPSSPPSSAPARVRGMLRNARASLAVLEGQLAGRDPKDSDKADIGSIEHAIESLVEDKWVTDGFATTEIQWSGEDLAEAAGIVPPAKTRPTN